MGGSTGTQTTTTQSDPWKPQQPYLKKGFAAADQLLNMPGPKWFPKSTVVGFSPQQRQAQDWGTRFATQGDPGMAAAQDMNTQFMQGKFLQNPYNDQVFNEIQSKVNPAVNAQFAGAGRLGSGLNQSQMTRELTSAYAPYASQNYQQGLDRMQNAIGQQQQFTDDTWRRIGALDAIGAQRQQLAQNERDDQVARWQYYQDMPYNKLAQYMGLIQGNYGGTTTSMTPYYKPGLFGKILGGGLGLLGALM